MSEKHRSLPLWMVNPDVQSRKVNDAVRKKTKKRPRSAVAYWMNERELVETALCLMNERKACARDATKTAEVATVIPETDAETSDCDVRDRTYVSDTDCDVAEQQTVPYGSCANEGTSAKADNRLKPHSSGSGRSEKPRVEEPSQKPASGDEALQLVREIFFT